MSAPLTTSAPWPIRWCPIYYGWVQVLLAALAMTATLPGRTHGLGMITEPLLIEASLSRSAMGWMNFAACLLGAVVCIPVGRWIDRRGINLVFPIITFLLGGAVWLLTQVQEPWLLFLALFLVRGLGQSALSVVSLATIGKWFDRQSAPAMGLFSVLLTIGIISLILATGAGIESAGWRPTWRSLAAGLCALAAIGWLLARDKPGARVLTGQAEPIAPSALFQFGHWQELWRNPYFWVFAIGMSLFNLAWSGLTLFNESILAERNFDQSAAVLGLTILTGCGLLANIVAGALLRREHLPYWLAVGMLLLAGALGSFPLLSTRNGLIGYFVLLGLTGGIVTVLFFAAWSMLFGAGQLATVQGAAQGATVVASAIGPVLFAECQQRLGSYTPAFYLLAGCAVMMACLAWRLSRANLPQH